VWNLTKQSVALLCSWVEVGDDGLFELSNDLGPLQNRLKLLVEWEMEGEPVYDFEMVEEPVEMGGGQE
jgi:hypothetical protein